MEMALEGLCISEQRWGGSQPADLLQSLALGGVPWTSHRNNPEPFRRPIQYLWRQRAAHGDIFRPSPAAEPRALEHFSQFRGSGALRPTADNSGKYCFGPGNDQRWIQDKRIRG